VRTSIIPRTPSYLIIAGTNEPFPGNFICADSDPVDGTHWTVYYWAAILVVESILLSLALRKAWQHRKSAHGSSLMQELTKDSVIYFFTSVFADRLWDDVPLMKVSSLEFSGYILPTSSSGTRIE
jgi:hypothetical protein